MDLLERPVLSNDEARRIYDHAYFAVMNEPEEESRFHKSVLWICEHTSPCKENLEQMREDIAGGMSPEDARARGLVRTVIAFAPIGQPPDLVEVGPRIPVGLPVAHPELEAGNLGTGAKVPEPPPNRPMQMSKGKGKGFKSRYSDKDIVEIRAEQTEKVSEGKRALGEETENVHPKRLQAVDQYHHLLVQQLRRWFKSKGINIDGYTVKLSADEHRWIHNEYRWNELWKDFRKANPNASPEEIFAEMRRLQAQVGLEGLDLVPYPN